MIRVRLLPLVLIPLLALAAACGSTATTNPGANPTTGGTSAAAGPCTYTSDGSGSTVKAPPSTPDPSAPTSMTISTNFGDIPIVLEPKTAPCTVNSFVSLAAQGYFNNTHCHRLTTQGYYVLQCGDPTGTGSGGPGYSFADELVPNDPRLLPCGNSGGSQICTYNSGTIAMANSGPNTNGSQFFLVYGPSQFPPAYTVLGHMDAAGLKVVKKIAAAGVGKLDGMGPGDGAPKNPVTITSVR